MLLLNTDSARWQALQRRDKAAHSAFVYGVTSTYIFCRPTCASRLARRTNIRFFNNAAEATVAGFRACKRCRPEIVETSNHATVLVSQACKAIDDAGGNILVAGAARAVGVSARHLHNLFRDIVGCTPAGYARMVRGQGHCRIQDVRRGDEGAMQYSEANNIRAIAQWSDSSSRSDGGFASFFDTQDAELQINNLADDELFMLFGNNDFDLELA